MITIGKYSFESIAEWSSWNKSKIYDCSFGILVYMKILIEFFSIGPTYTIFKMRKQLWIGHPGGSYGMIKARVVASFQHILAPVFGGNLESVLKME